MQGVFAVRVIIFIFAPTTPGFNNSTLVTTAPKSRTKQDMNTVVNNTRRMFALHKFAYPCNL